MPKPPTLTFTRFLACTAAALALALAWDASALDLPLARWFGTAQGFALTHDWWLQNVLHTGARLGLNGPAGEHVELEHAGA